VEGNGRNQERGKGYIRGTERQWLGKAAPSASSQTHRIFSPHPLFVPTSHTSNYPSRTRLAATSHRYLPRAPQSKKLQTVSSNSSFTYSQSSNGSQATDYGSGNCTGRQLRSGTRRHDSAPASQQAQADSLLIPPDTQDRIHLSQDRTTTSSTQSSTNCQNTNTRCQHQC